MKKFSCFSYSSSSIILTWRVWLYEHTHTHTQRPVSSRHINEVKHFISRHPHSCPNRSSWLSTLWSRNAHGPLSNINNTLRSPCATHTHAQYRTAHMVVSFLLSRIRNSWWVNQSRWKQDAERINNSVKGGKRKKKGKQWGKSRKPVKTKWKRTSKRNGTWKLVVCDTE